MGLIDKLRKAKPARSREDRDEDVGEEDSAGFEEEFQGIDDIPGPETPDDPEVEEALKDDEAGADEAAPADDSVGDLPPIPDDLPLEEDDFDEDEDFTLAERLEELWEERPAAFLSAVAVVALLLVGSIGAGAWWIISGTVQSDEMVAEAQDGAADAGAGPDSEMAAESPDGDASAAEEGGLQPPDAAAEETAEDEAPADGSDGTDFAELAERADQGSLNALATESATGTVVMATAQAAFGNYPDRPASAPLPDAPVPELLEIRGGDVPALPQVSGEKLPWQTYARPSDVPPDRPRVAVVITGMGLSQAETLAAIRKLPPQVTLAFDPYADGLDEWLIRARRNGHEVLVSLPLGSSRFPIEDPGPFSLLTQLSTSENMDRLNRVLSRFQGYAGVMTTMGSKFASSQEHMRPVLSVLQRRGLMLVDGTDADRSVAPQIARSLGLPVVPVQVRLGDAAARRAVRRSLDDVLELLAENRHAVVSTRLTPMVLEELNDWFGRVAGMRGEVVPVTALVDVQTAT